jgi:hypothetical protein
MLTRDLVARLLEEGEDKGLGAEALALCEVADALRDLTRAVREDRGDPPEDETLD